MISRLRRTAEQDSGAMLIFALFIITTIAVVLAAIWGQADASIRTSVAIRDEAGSAYNGDAAAQLALNNIRTGYGFTNSGFNNAVGSNCFGTSGGTLNLRDFYPPTGGQAATGASASAASSASVVCAGEQGTGAQGSPVPITSGNRPGNAILTLGTSTAEDGINVKPLSSAIPFNVHGGIVSDSNIEVKSGTLQTNTTAWANSGCNIRTGDNGSIVAGLGKDCGHTTVSDPNYSNDATLDAGGAVPAYRAVPSSCPGNIATFQPGYYDDAKALSDFMTSTTCVYWFKPGTYYFDFHNTENPLLPSQSGDVWTISRGSLVAGTATDASGNPIVDGNHNPLQDTNANPTLPGACENPIDSTKAIGVQFIFGGDSQMVVSNGANAEICGTYHKPATGRTFIAVYGQKSGSESTTQLTGANAVKMTGQTATPSNNFTNLARVAAIDASSATWVKAGNSTQTTTITATGFSPASAIPAGSIVTAATIKVAHGNSTGYQNQDSLSLAYTPTSGSTTGSAINLTPSKPSSTGLVTDSLDLFGSGSSAFDQFVHTNGLSSGSVSYATTLAHASTESVDGIQLAVSYKAPAFRGENTSINGSNCLQTDYTGGSAGQCAVVSTPTNFSGKFYIQGTTYTPIAPIDLTLNNVTAQVLRFGVICRTLWLKETGSISYSGPVIEIPDNSTDYGTSGTIVDLSVYVCPGVSTASCSTDPSARLQLTARVMIWDNTGIPVPNKRQLNVLSWSQQR